MKIRPHKVTLDELGYEGYWVEIPRSIKEGQATKLMELGAKVGAAVGTEAAREAHKANVQILQLVSDWNLTDDQENPIPVPRTVSAEPEGDSPRDRAVGEVTIDVIQFVIKKLTSSGAEAVPERVRDF